MKVGRETCVKLFPLKTTELPGHYRWTRCEAYFRFHATTIPVYQALYWQSLMATPDTLSRCVHRICRNTLQLKSIRRFWTHLPKKAWLLTGMLSNDWKEYLLPYVSQSNTNSSLTGWREFWPSQLTSAYIRGWTAGWSDAQFLRTTVEELYLSDWANVSYLAGLPPRFPYRMSPDGLPHLTRDESGLPVSDIFLLSAFSWLVPILIAHVVEWDRHVAKTLITNEG